MYHAKQNGRDQCVSWSSIRGDNMTGSRRRVLKAGSIMFNDKRSTIDCTIRSLGVDVRRLQNRVQFKWPALPPQFVLCQHQGEGFETNCH